MADDLPPSMPDLGDLLGMVMNLQQQVVAAQQETAETTVVGQAGGGAVRIEVTGGFDFRSVWISPSALDPGDLEMLQDLVLAALRDAVERVAELSSGADPLAGAMGGFDLGALGAGGPDLGALVGALGITEIDEVEGEEPEGAEPEGAEPEGAEPEGEPGAGPRH